MGNCMGDSKDKWKEAKQQYWRDLVRFNEIRLGIYPRLYRSVVNDEELARAEALVETLREAVQYAIATGNGEMIEDLRDLSTSERFSAFRLKIPPHIIGQRSPWC